MFSNRSPPKHTKKLIKGGSSNALLSSLTSTSPTFSLSSTTSSSCSSASASAATALTPLKLVNSSASSNSSTCRTPAAASGSTLSLYSNSSTNALLAASSGEKQHGGLHYHHSHAHAHSHHQQQTHHSAERSGGSGGTSGRNSLSLNTTKRGKKQNWGARDRAGMSFLIVIAFFAVFGLIILTEIFMIDERSHGGMMVLRHGGSFSSRLGDSMPDYDNVKDDYDVLDDSLLSDNKLGYVQLRDNKLKIQDVDNNDALAAGNLAGVLLKSAGGGVGGGTNGFGGGGGAAAAGAAAAGAAVGAGNNVPLIPWGKVLPTKIEETLPHYPIGTQPTDGSWQVVNGTRFKFFVFSAYYDRRDGAKLVRVIGATKTRGPERVWCRFWYPGGERYTSATVMARVKVIRENWNLKYSACFIICPVRTPELDVPHYVSIVARLRAPPGNLLELRNTDWDADFAATAAASVNHTTHNASSAATGALPTRKSRFLSMTLASRATVAPRSPTLPTGEQIADKIAVCVKPFHFNYDQALYLMEYLEFYALMGVAHFTFYNHTIGPHAACVLQHYVSGDIPENLTAWDNGVAGQQQAPEGAAKTEAVPTNNNNNNSNGSSINNSSNTRTARAGGAAVAGSTEFETGKVTKAAGAGAAATKTRAQHFEKSTNYIKPTVNILPWNLRMRSQKEIRTEGLFAALNDCLYRTMYRYKYLALVDLDEFIVPRHNDTLNELINSLNQRFRNRNMGAYSFQNAFFYLQFPDDPLVSSQNNINVNDENARLRAALVTQRKTRRRFKLHPQKQRSKYICKPEAVVEAGNHFVWEFSPGKGSLNVPPTDAILQHYRVCEFGGNDCIKAPSIIDRTATKYVNRLMQRVDAVYRHLKQSCDLPELPVLPSQQEQQQKAALGERSKGIEVNRKLQRDIKNNNNNNNDETNMNNEGAEGQGQKEKEETKSAAAAAAAAGATATTTNATIKQTTKATTTNANATTNSAAKPMNIRKKHKMISFENDENGVPCARVEYV